MLLPWASRGLRWNPWTLGFQIGWDLMNWYLDSQIVGRDWSGWTAIKNCGGGGGPLFGGNTTPACFQNTCTAATDSQTFTPVLTGSGWRIGELDANKVLTGNPSIWLRNQAWTYLLPTSKSPTQPAVPAQGPMPHFVPYEETPIGKANPKPAPVFPPKRPDPAPVPQPRRRPGRPTPQRPRRRPVPQSPPDPKPVPQSPPVPGVKPVPHPFPWEFPQVDPISVPPGQPMHPNPKPLPHPRIPQRPNPNPNRPPRERPDRGPTPEPKPKPDPNPQPNPNPNPDTNPYPWPFPFPEPDNWPLPDPFPLPDGQSESFEYSPAVQPNGEPLSPTVAVKPHLRRPPGGGTRERKVITNIPLRGLFHALTEGSDVVDCLIDALPEYLQKRYKKRVKSRDGKGTFDSSKNHGKWVQGPSGGFGVFDPNYSSGMIGKLNFLDRHWNSVDMNKFIECAVLNHYEDKIVGALNRGAQRGTGRPDPRLPSVAWGV